MFGSFNFATSFTQLQGLNETLQKFKEEVEHNITDSVANRASTSLADGFKTFTGGLGGLSALQSKDAPNTTAPAAEGFATENGQAALLAESDAATIPAESDAATIPAESDAATIPTESDAATIPVLHDMDSMRAPQVIGDGREQAMVLNGEVHDGDSHSVDGDGDAPLELMAASAEGPSGQSDTEGWDADDVTIEQEGTEETGWDDWKENDVAAALPSEGAPEDVASTQHSPVILEDSLDAAATQLPSETTVLPAAAAADAPAEAAAAAADSPADCFPAEAAAEAAAVNPADTPVVSSALPCTDLGEDVGTPVDGGPGDEAVNGVDHGDGAVDCEEAGAQPGTDDTSAETAGHMDGTGQGQGRGAERPPLEDLESLDAAALRAIVATLRETLSARENQLERSYSEVAQMREATEKINAKNQELARRCAKISEEDLEQMRQEFEDRLAAADRKVYALTKERDALRRGTEKLSGVNELLKAKDEMIKDVLEEGERLSKKQLQQESTIRKLRGQVKDAEEELGKVQKKLSKSESDVDALRRDKSALEMQLQSVMDRHRREMEAEKRHFQSMLDAANSARAEAESKAASSAKEELTKRLKDAEEQASILADTVEQLRGAMEQQQAEAYRKEDVLQRELVALEQRCQEAEMRHEELALRFPEATRPLVQQIEALQAASTAQSAAWVVTERNLVERAREAEARAAAAAEKERIAVDRMQSAQSMAASHQAALEVARLESRDLLSELEASRSERVAAEQQLHQLQAKLQEVEAQHESWAIEKRDVERMLETQLDALQAQNASLGKRLRDLEDGATKHKGVQPPALAAPGYKWVLLPSNGSGTASGGSSSLLMGSSSSLRPPIDDNGNEVAVLAVTDEQLPRTRAEIEETVQQLRMKEQRVSVLQDMVEQLESTRDRLSQDLISLTQRAGHADSAASELDKLRREMSDLHARHVAAVELLGEREEQVEELKADLIDLRSIMKQQVMYVVDAIERGTTRALPSSHSI